MQYNIRTITCDACCEPALEIDTDKICPSMLDGKVCICQSCAVLGRVDAEEYIRFYPLSKEDLSFVDFSLIVEAYEASQNKICELYEEISNLKKELK